MNTRPVLITDFDGTLVRSMPVAWEFLNSVAEKKGKRLQHYEEYRSTWGLYWDVIRTFWLRSLKLLPRMRRYMYLNDTKIDLYSKNGESLQTLRKAGWKVVIVTDNDDEYVKKILSRNDIDMQGDWLEIFSAETETKLSLYLKVLKKFQGSQLYFTSHDTKDFVLITLATLLTRKGVLKVFTPNEIDKRSLIHPQLTLPEFVEKYCKS